MQGVRILGPEAPILGEDGRWRAWVEFEGLAGAMIVTAEEAREWIAVQGSSATWATTAEEKAALADLMRRR